MRSYAKPSVSVIISSVRQTPTTSRVIDIVLLIPSFYSNFSELNVLRKSDNEGLKYRNIT